LWANLGVSARASFGGYEGCTNRRNRMNKRSLFGIVLTLVVVMAAAAPASATPPTDVSGTYMLSQSPPDYMEWRPAGDNCKLECGFTYPFDGDLEGEATFHYSLMVHGPCTADEPPGQGLYYTTLKAWGTFTGEVVGESGSFTFTYEGKEWPYGQPGDLGLRARIVILSGTEELENLHGLLDVSYMVGDLFDTYSGQIHFDPE
jgi:hypothetical protein